MGLLLRVSIRARRTKMRPDVTRILGLTGRAETSIDPLGAVFLRNELWPARSPITIERGARVKVTSLAGLTLCVEPVESESVDN